MAAILHEFQLPISSESTLRTYVEVAFQTKIPDIQVCPGHTTPWRAFVDAYFGIAPVTVWKASRGFGGKSYLLALLGLTEATTLKADVNVLGGSGEQSENVHKYTQTFWRSQSAPRSLLASDPMKRETRLAWGNNIKALTASQRSVRGPHPQRLRLDEIDEMDMAIFEAALGQPMSSRGVSAQTVASSTHQYSDGTMSQVLARAGERSWPLYEWCYRECLEPHGWLSQKDVDDKKATVTQTMWDTEYELQEPNPESRAIMPGAVAVMFQRQLGEYEGAPHEYIEVESPVPEGQYATGADWARKNDWTVITTFRTDVRPARLVAFERTGRLEWPVMIARLSERIKRFGGASAHDATGLGDVVSGFLAVVVEPVIMVGRTRSDLFSEYIAAVERHEVAAPFIHFMQSEHNLASVDSVYGSGHPPDSIASAALAWFARAQARRRRPPGTVKYA
jgi:hypothetical protein